LHATVAALVERARLVSQGKSLERSSKHTPDAPHASDCASQTSSRTGFFKLFPVESDRGSATCRIHSRRWRIRSDAGFGRTTNRHSSLDALLPIPLYQLATSKDGHHLITYMSVSARMLLHLPREGDIPFDSLLAAMADEDRAAYYAALEDARRGAGCSRHTFRVSSRIGSHAWMRQELHVQPGQHKRAGISTLVYLIDMTQQVLLKETLKEVRESKRALMRLFDVITEGLCSVHGDAPLPLETTVIPSMVARVAARHEHGARQRGIQLHHHVDARVNHTLQTSSMLLEEVLNSLLYHAIAATWAGEVRLEVQLLGRTAAQQTVSFAVIDTDSVRSHERKPMLFEPLGPVLSGGARSEVGARLDLATCYGLANLMGGALKIDSSMGKGSTTVLTCTFALHRGDLPCVAGNPSCSVPSAPVWRTAVPTGALEDRPFRILLAGSHSLDRLRLLRQVQAQGYTAEIAEDATRALEMWKTGRFSIVIAECHTATMDGYALADAIRNAERRRGIAPTPIIGCSASDQQDAAARCRTVGMTDHLSKPVSAALLRAALERYSHPPGTATASAIHPSATPYDSPVDMRMLASLSGGDEGFERDIFQSFCSNSLSDAALLDTAVAARDLANAGRLAHKIAGASLLIGAARLAEICRHMEQAGLEQDLQAMLDNLDLLHQEIRRVTAFIDPFGTVDATDAARHVQLAGEQADLGFMVVEDHALQRTALVRMLSGMGARVIHEAQDGQDAVELISALGGSVDVVIIDLNMPNMDGMELIRRLSASNDALSIILVSAVDPKLLASVGTMTEAYGAHLLGVLEKPLTPAKLAPLIALHAAVVPAASRPVPLSFPLKRIAAGMENGEFEMFLQPKVDVASGRLVGAEALVRWRHPEHGVVAPASFIPALEDDNNGLIDDLTWMMLGKVARFCRTLQSATCADMTISINLSLVSLAHVQVADQIIQIVQDAEANPAQIVLEITESAATTDLGHALENLARLRMHGFGLSIDDYGTGYSSMQQLERIAFTELKIDQSFVRNASKRPSARVILESSLAMATRLNMTSVAEGVETQADFDLLAELGCDVAQGFFIARPMDEASMRAWMIGHATTFVEAACG
jgi:EAL domain-containing protein (putative c-di-GMP-specific phosphodiesterase class I)/DNA-binding response OmpR family regulator/HPt (histidine-containing phosphotransfer) domain-containing protein